VLDGGGIAPYGLCDIAHQGLVYDKEFGLYYNRARYFHPTLGRYNAIDPGRYVDGNNLYEYERGNPETGLDRWGGARIAHGGREGDGVYLQ